MDKIERLRAEVARCKSEVQEFFEYAMNGDEGFAVMLGDAERRLFVAEWDLNEEEKRLALLSSKEDPSSK